MKKPLFAVLFIFSVVQISCGTYRTGTGDYKGMGSYRTPSDYSKGVDSSDYTASEMQDSHARLKSHAKYAPLAQFKLYWPVEQVQINRGFHPSSDAKHQGIDLGGKAGVQVLAAHEGLVVYAGRDFRSYGNMVLLEYNNEWATLYGHLADFAVKEGQIVAPGDPLGTMGATGHATGVHLHFELMHNREPVDPIPLLTRAKKIAAH